MNDFGDGFWLGVVVSTILYCVYIYFDNKRWERQRSKLWERQDTINRRLDQLDKSRT